MAATFGYEVHTGPVAGAVSASAVPERAGSASAAGASVVGRRVVRRAVDYVWAVARIGLGWIFLWAFLDKVFGWGFATPAERAWVNGGSPTTGFLRGTGENALGGVFGGLAGQVWVDWLFMFGLLGVGVALVLGVGLYVAAVAGGLMMVLMWAAALPLETNPFVDDHLVYAVVLTGLALSGAGVTWGVGAWWAATPLVRRFPVLR